PGKTAKFKLEVENLQSRFPVEVMVEGVEALPTGWVAETKVAVVSTGGFRIPQTLGEAKPFTLLPSARGANRAAVEVHVTAPTGLSGEETFETEFRAT